MWELTIYTCYTTAACVSDFFKGDQVVQHVLRAAIAPFLAAKVFKGTFKWILYGDDDTLWVVDNLLRYLATLDHDVPYMLSDALWFLNRGPPGTPCCRWTHPCGSSSLP